MWMASVSSKTRIFSVPPLLVYIFVSLVLVSWILLAIGSYVGNRLYHDYCALQEENVQLLQKKMELKALRQTMKRIREDENTIRNFLGLEDTGTETGGLGQGGEPSPDLSTIAPDDAMTSSAALSPEDDQSPASVQEAQRLQADLGELVATLRDQHQRWNHTPSIVPVQGDDYWFSSGFGWRRSPFTGLKEFHNGLDISGRRNTPIIAPANGSVLKRGYDKYLGKYLQIDHGNNIVTTCGHLATFNVSSGQKVKRGDVIAFMGNTGLSTGHHLHYMIKVKNRVVNPMHYILNARVNPLFMRTQPAEDG